MIVLKSWIKNNAITGEKSSIIPPPRGDLPIIFLMGPRKGSVST